MLKVTNLVKTFGSHRVLDGVSFQVQRGHIAVFLGSSGVGKSTLLRVLNNLEPYDSGSFELDGKSLDIATVNRSGVVSMVFQHFNLFEHLNVQDNITLALRHAHGMDSEQANSRATGLLERYGLTALARKQVTRLSGGQKQRLALARTIALQPHIICLDEPTSALDPLLTSSVAQSIAQLAADNFVVLVATHDVSLLSRLDCTIYLMHHGTIVQAAASKEFFANPQQFDQLDRFVRGHHE